MRIYSVANVTLDDSGHRVWINDTEVTLRPLEYRILRAFMQNAGHALTRNQLLDLAYDTEIAESLNSERTIDVMVRRLRVAGVRGIKTLTGLGYRMDHTETAPLVFVDSDSRL